MTADPDWTVHEPGEATGLGRASVASPSSRPDPRPGVPAMLSSGQGSAGGYGTAGAYFPVASAVSRLLNESLRGGWL